MIGTIVNIAAIIFGGTLGLLFRHRLPQKVVKVVFQGIGLFTLALGVKMFLKSEWMIVVVLSLLAGGVAGGLLNLEDRMNRFSERLKGHFRLKDARFTEGLITSFLLFCMGAMTILGAVDEGIGNGPELLMTKSVLDGFASIALAASLGAGVLFSVIPLLIYQGGITLLAIGLGDFFALAIINELTATGGVLLIGLGLNILNITKIKVINLLPSLLFVIGFAWLYLKFFQGQ